MEEGYLALFMQTGQPLFNNMAAGMASGTCIGMAIGSFIDCIKKQ